jgi:hypothetical protein
MCALALALSQYKASLRSILNSIKTILSRKHYSVVSVITFHLIIIIMAKWLTIKQIFESLLLQTPKTTLHCIRDANYFSTEQSISSPPHGIALRFSSMLAPPSSSSSSSLSTAVPCLHYCPASGAAASGLNTGEESELSSSLSLFLL